MFQTPLKEYDWIDVSAYTIGTFCTIIVIGSYFLNKGLLTTWIGYGLFAGICFFLGYVAACKLLNID
jgi:hypothetical protein